MSFNINWYASLVNFFSSALSILNQIFITEKIPCFAMVPYPAHHTQNHSDLTFLSLEASYNTAGALSPVVKILKIPKFIHHKSKWELLACQKDPKYA